MTLLRSSKGFCDFTFPWRMHGVCVAGHKTLRIWRSQHLGWPLSFGKVLFTWGVRRAGMKAAGTSGADGIHCPKFSPKFALNQCTHPRNFLRTMPKMKARFPLVTLQNFTCVQVMLLLVGVPGHCATPKSHKNHAAGHGNSLWLQSLLPSTRKTFFLHHSKTLVSEISPVPPARKTFFFFF